MGYKAYSDSYLISLTKAQIIELLRVAEHNFFTTEEALNNSAKAGMEIAAKFDEAKRLLKAAVEDVAALAKAFNNDEPCGSFTPCSECPFDSPKGYCMEWRFKAEALTLMGEDGDTNG